MELTKQINQIPFQQVFNVLGIKTFKKWFWSFGIEWEWKRTDGYVLNERENLVNDFSGKRPRGDVIKFVQEYLKLEFPEAVDWCGKTFNLKSEIKMETKTFKPIIAVETKDNATKYLESRGISMQKLSTVVKVARQKTMGKDVRFDWECIACEMKDMKGKTVGVQYRSIEWKAFYTDGNDGFFYQFTWDIRKKNLFVVEWMTDFLSLRQYTPSVIGIKSSQTPIDNDFKRFVEKFDNIYLLFDNDQSGKNAKDRFKSIVTGTRIYEIVWDEKIDVNDLCNELWLELIDWIISNSELTQSPSFEHIDSETRLELGLKELDQTNPDSVISWGWEEFDKKLGYIMGWQLILIWGTTGTGKSTLVNQICANVSEQGFRVARYSLEDRIQEKVKEEIYFRIGRIRKQGGQNNYPWSEFERNNIQSATYNEERKLAIEEYRRVNKNIIDLSHNKLVSIDELEHLMEKEVEKGCKIFCIDHLHYFDMGTDDKRHDLMIQRVMQKINEIARKNNIAVIILAHYKKIGNNKPTNDDFKDSAAISQIANKVIHITRDKELPPNDNGEFETEFVISKNRSPMGTWVITWYFNQSTYEYDFKKSEAQIQRSNLQWD